MTSCGIFPSGDFRSGSLRKATTDVKSKRTEQNVRIGKSEAKVTYIGAIIKKVTMRRSRYGKGKGLDTC